MKPDQSPAALGKAPQDPPLTTVQVALAPDMGGVVELLGGRLHPTTPAGKEAHPAMPMPERALLAAVRQPPRTPLAVLHEVEPLGDVEAAVPTQPGARRDAVVELHAALAWVRADQVAKVGVRHGERQNTALIK